MAKTIKQIVDEIGISKQAVHQKRKSKLLSTSLQPFTTTVDGVDDNGCRKRFLIWFLHLIK